MWLFGGMLALLGGVLLVAIVALGSLAVTIWAIVDACCRSEVAWRRTGQNRALWVAVLIGGWLVTGIVGVVLALAYLAAVRPRLLAAELRPQRRSAPPEHVRLALRVADADRDQAGARLRHHFSVGRLTYDELLERLDEAYGARTVADLERSLRELPPR